MGPAAKTVTAGAAATTLMATLTGSTSAIAWSLSGDGASSATSGTTITVDGWTEEIGGATVTALLVPNSSATGDTTFPVTPAADGSFSVVNVSGGVYFIQVDQPVPDLTLAIYGRADHTSSALRTTLGVNVSGLTPLADPPSKAPSPRSWSSPRRRPRSSTCVPKAFSRRGLLRETPRCRASSTIQRPILRSTISTEFVNCDVG